MSEVVVTSSNSAVVVNRDTSKIILSGQLGPPGRSEVSLMEDVDLTNLQDGGILVYAQNIAKWQATNLLEKQIMNGGFF